MRVLFCGFFGIKDKHIKLYSDLWKCLGAKEVDVYKYNIMDAVSYSRWKTFRKSVLQHVNKEYDVAYVMSGGSLHLHNLYYHVNPVRYKSIIYDSGPYLPRAHQVERYIHNKFHLKLPYQSMINQIWKIEGANIPYENKLYLEQTHHPDIPKLVLYSQNDNLIDNGDIQDFIKNQRICKYYNFQNAEHVQLYKKYPEIYAQQINLFLKDVSIFYS